jgi:hypothetical protein
MRNLFVTLALLSAWPAHAALDVAMDCYLPSASVSCSSVERAFFSNPAYQRVVEGVTPDATVVVRGLRISDGVSYTIDVTSKDGAKFSLEDRIPYVFTQDAVVLRLVGDMQKSTAHLFVVEDAKTEGDVLTLTLRDPDAGPRSARKDDETTGWYIAPWLNLNASLEGIRNVDGSAGVEVNWSHPAWRVFGWTWTNYRYISTDDPTGTLRPEDRTYQNLDVGTDWTVVRNLFDGVSLGANIFTMREPRENYAWRAGTLIGAEWLSKAFIKTDDGNYGVRYEIGAEHQDYVLQTVLLKRTHDYMRHRLRLFGRWHFSRVDLNGGVVAKSVLNDLRFSEIEVYGGLTWRVLDDLSLETWSEAGYRNGLVNEPKDLSKLHPLEQFYGGGSYGDLVAEQWVGVRYTFGNSMIKTQDQRWR